LKVVIQKTSPPKQTGGLFLCLSLSQYRFYLPPFRITYFMVEVHPEHFIFGYTNNLIER